MTKLLVVGCGSIGGRHARNARTLGVSQLAVHDVDARRRSELAEAVGAESFDTLDAALRLGSRRRRDLHASGVAHGRRRGLRHSRLLTC